MLQFNPAEQQRLLVELHCRTNKTIYSDRYSRTRLILGTIFRWNNPFVYLLMYFTALVLVSQTGQLMAWPTLTGNDSSPHQDISKDINSYVLAAQATLVGLLFPIVVGLVTLIVQGGATTSDSSDVKIYYRESLTLQIGASSFALLLALAIQLVWPLLDASQAADLTDSAAIGRGATLTLLHITWFCANVVGFWYFVRLSVEFVAPQTRALLRRRYISNVILPGSLLEIVSTGTKDFKSTDELSTVLEQLSEDVISAVERRALTNSKSSLQIMVDLHTHYLLSLEKGLYLGAGGNLAEHSRQGRPLFTDWSGVYSRVTSHALDSIATHEEIFHSLAYIPMQLHKNISHLSPAITEDIIGIHLRIALEIEDWFVRKCNHTQNNNTSEISASAPQELRTQYIHAIKINNVYWELLIRESRKQVPFSDETYPTPKEWNNAATQVRILQRHLRNVVLALSEAIRRNNLLGMRQYVSLVLRWMNNIDLHLWNSRDESYTSYALSLSIFELNFDQIRGLAHTSGLHSAKELVDTVLVNAWEDHVLLAASVFLHWYERGDPCADLAMNAARRLIYRKDDLTTTYLPEYPFHRGLWSLFRTSASGVISSNRSYGGLLDEMIWFLDSRTGSEESPYIHNDSSSHLFSKGRLLHLVYGLILVSRDSIDVPHIRRSVQANAAAPQLIEGADRGLKHIVQTLAELPLANGQACDMYCVVSGDKSAACDIAPELSATLRGDITEQRTRRLRKATVSTKNKEKFDKSITYCLNKLLECHTAHTIPPFARIEKVPRTKHELPCISSIFPNTKGYIVEPEILLEDHLNGPSQIASAIFEHIRARVTQEFLAQGCHFRPAVPVEKVWEQLAQAQQKYGSCHVFCSTQLWRRIRQIAPPSLGKIKGVQGHTSLPILGLLQGITFINVDIGSYLAITSIDALVLNLNIREDGLLVNTEFAETHGSYPYGHSIVRFCWDTQWNEINPTVIEVEDN